MANLNIYRDASVLYTIGIDESTVYSGQVVGENKVTANFSSPVKLTILIGDYIQHNAQTFKLNKSVEETKVSEFEYRYSATFEGLEYSLYNKVIEHLGTADFSYFGTPDTFLDLIIDNINAIDAGWTKGDVEVIEGGKFINFENESCREALTKVAEAFELEFSFDGKIINLVKTVGVDTAIVFEYGQNNGLDSLIRKPVNDQQFGTRFIGYGSTQNIPADYRGGKKRLSFNPGYIDKNVATYGIIERPVVFDYIFPRRTGSATAMPSILQLTDSTLDFNLNDVIVDGKAKIVFKSGDLQGNEFEIASYNNTTKTITFNANVEENGYTLPNETVKALVGDTYTLIGIEMPESYITAAEAELQTATEEYAETFKNPFYAYDLPINEKFIRDNNLVGALNRGDRVRVIDAPMGVDTILRIQAISYPLCNPGKITATINDKVSYTLAERILKTVTKQKQQISVVYKNVSEVNRDLAIKQREFQNRVFDPDGYFDGGKIKPETVEAISIASGARSQQFTLSVIFQPNYDADPNAVYWSAGKLVHSTISDDAIRTWDIAASNRTDLVTLEAYYIYAKCDKTGLNGTIVFDTVARRVNDDPDFYYFLIGQLSSVIGGVRWPQLTYGTSTINGRFMTTGRVQSANLQSYIDLDTNQFNFGNEISGIDYNVTTPNQLTVRGHIEATSGTIAGVEINAGNNFNLLGSKVIIKPNEGIEILDNGYLKALTVEAQLNGGTSRPIFNAVSNITGYSSTLFYGQVLDVDSDIYDLIGLYNNTNSLKFKVNGKGDGYFNGKLDVAGNVTAPVLEATDTLFIPTTPPTELIPGKAAIYIGDLSGITDVPGSDYVLPIASASILGGIKIGSGLTISGDGTISVTTLGGVTSFNTRTGAISLNSDDVTGALGFTPYNATNPSGYITSGALSGYATESWATGNFASLTGYNKSNWDSAYGWGNHASVGYALANGSNASGTWGINISGNAHYAENSSKLYSTDSSYSFGSSNPYFGYLSYNGSSNRWRFQVSPGTPAEVEVAYADNSSLWRGYEHNMNSVISSDNFDYALTATGAVISKNTKSSFKTWLNLNDGSTLNNNISGNATLWGNTPADFSNIPTNMASILGYDNTAAKMMSFSSTQAKGFLGINDGSTLTNSISGNAQSATSWGGLPALFDGTRVTNPYAVPAYNSSTSRVELADGAGLANIIGLGSNAYSSTAYLPLSGGQIVGNTSLKNSYLFFENNGGSTALLTSSAVLAGGTDNDFNTYVYGDYQYGIWTNGSRRLSVGGDGNATFSNNVTASSFYTNNWFRSTGASGWFNQDYDGGIYMEDTSWVRVYSGKGFLVGGTVGIQSPRFMNTTDGFKSYNYRGMVGDYDQNSSSEKIIWTIGDNWNTLATMYGLGYTYNNISGFGHSLFMALNGTKTIQFSLETGSASFNGQLYSEGINLNTDLKLLSNAGYGIISQDGTRAIAITNSLVAIDSDTTVAGTFIAPAIKATSVLKIPTTAPPSGALQPGEACMYIGDLSGITT